MILLHIYLLVLTPCIESFSVDTGMIPNVTPTSQEATNRVKNLFTAAAETNDDDVTTLPSSLLQDNYFNAETTTVMSASELVPASSSTLEQQNNVSLTKYIDHTSKKHSDCLNLFDGYNTQVIRCETLALDSSSSDAKDNASCELNIRWEASWIPAGSTWLYTLADLAGWDIERKVPDPSRISTFSWKNVFQLFEKAFETGTISLPISLVEGNTRLRVTLKESESESESSMGEFKSSSLPHTDVSISLMETIDLIREADLGRIQNRRVAQELALWLDVSRRPISSFDEEEWAALVRERILTGVPGSGPLDVDPNEDGDEGGIAVAIFAILCIGASSLFYNVLMDYGTGYAGVSVGANQLADFM